MMVREWAEYWQEKYDAPTVRRTSYEAHRYVLENHIILRLGECELAELTAGRVGEFLAERRAHGNRRTGGLLSEVTMGHISIPVGVWPIYFQFGGTGSFVFKQFVVE